MSKRRRSPIGVIQWLACLYRTDQPYGIRDPEAEREYWLPRLDAAAAEAPRESVPFTFDDFPPLGDEEVVAIPAEVPAHERAAVAWVVRAIRWGRSAEARGKPEIARREYAAALAEVFAGLDHMEPRLELRHRSILLRSARSGLCSDPAPRP